MNIYEIDEDNCKISGKSLKLKRVGYLPNRINILHNEAENLTKKELKEHLYSTKELLKRIVTDIEQIEKKL